MPAHYLGDPRYDPAKQLEHSDLRHQREQGLRAALLQLDARSQDILQQRWLTDTKATTLRQLAEQYGVSAERVRQLEKNAMNKVKQMLKNLASFGEAA